MVLKLKFSKRYLYLCSEYKTTTYFITKFNNVTYVTPNGKNLSLQNHFLIKFIALLSNTFY